MLNSLYTKVRPTRVDIRLLGRALRLGGRVGEGEDDGVLVVGRHLADNLRSKHLDSLYSQYFKIISKSKNYCNLSILL